MSMMQCEICESMVDTDYNVEGLFTGDCKYICHSCRDDQGHEDIEGDYTELTVKELIQKAYIESLLPRYRMKRNETNVS